MADRTLTINHADGGSETYTINRDKFVGVREMPRGHVYPPSIVTTTNNNAYYTFTSLSDTSFRVQSDLVNDGVFHWREVRLVPPSVCRSGKHLVEFDLTLHSGSLTLTDGTTPSVRILSRDGANGAAGNTYATTEGNNSIEIEVFDDGISEAEGDHDVFIAFSFRPESQFDITVSNIKVTHEADIVITDHTPPPAARTMSINGSSITISRGPEGGIRTITIDGQDVTINRSKNDQINNLYYISGGYKVYQPDSQSLYLQPK